MYNTHYVELVSGRAKPIDVEVRDRMYKDTDAAIAAAVDFPSARARTKAVGSIVRENGGPVVGSWFSNPLAAGRI